ncbi:MAG: phosphate-starvation-inducible PsiE family protein [Thermodesulfovibrionales bacterium]
MSRKIMPYTLQPDLCYHELMEQRAEFTELFRKWLIKIDIIFHVLAAILLLTACTMILYYATLNILNPTRDSIIHLVNDVLLSLIILELLWTVIRFLKKQKFILGPFLAIGIIAAVRRILLIEAQTSFMEHVPVEKLYEIGLSAVVIIILMIAYYLSVKAQKLEQ